MRIALALLVALALGALGWMLLGGEKGPALDESVQDATSPPERSEVLLESGGEMADPAPASSSVPRTTLTGLDPRTAPRGDLIVIPEDQDGHVVPIHEVKVKLMADGRPWPAEPLAFRDPATNEWTFRRVFAGPVKVVCHGDTIRDSVTKAQVTVKPQAPLRVRVRRAGAIHWHVRHENGATPPSVTLELFRDDRPVTAWYQERHLRRIVSRKRMRSAIVGHAGYISALKPGLYTLRATNSEGYYRDVTVNVALGEVADVKVVLRDTADVPAPPPPPTEEAPVAQPDPSQAEFNPAAKRK